MNWKLKHISLSLLLWFINMNLQAQDSLILNQIKRIDCFAVDAKNHFYVADPANSLYKFNARGEIITNVNTKVYGNISSIDCSNPFEIYTYYKDQNILVFYDNMLNHRGEIKFNSLGMSNIACIARSFDNGIWLYDYSDFQLKKLNKEGQVLSNSGNLNNFIDGEINPLKIVEYDNQVYLGDSILGILVFDMFGTYIKTIPLPGIYSFDVNHQSIAGISSTKLWLYDLRTLSRTEYNIKTGLPQVGFQVFGIFYCLSNRIFWFVAS